MLLETMQMIVPLTTVAVTATLMMCGGKKKKNKEQTTNVSSVASSTFDEKMCMGQVNKQLSTILKEKDSQDVKSLASKIESKGNVGESAAPATTSHTEGGYKVTCYKSSENVWGLAVAVEKVE